MVLVDELAAALERGAVLRAHPPTVLRAHPPKVLRANPPMALRAHISNGKLRAYTSNSTPCSSIERYSVLSLNTRCCMCTAMEGMVALAPSWSICCRFGKKKKWRKKKKHQIFFYRHPTHDLFRPLAWQVLKPPSPRPLAWQRIRILRSPFCKNATKRVAVTRFPAP